MPSPSPSPASDPRTTVERVAEVLALRIASARYRPGDRLPSMRSLAVEFGINPSTVQVVMARLQADGFVESHHGAGVTVRDVERYGGIASWRYLFRNAGRLPDRSARIFAQVLELRRTLVGQCLAALVRDPRAFDPTTVERAVDDMRGLIDADAELVEIARAELHAFRVLSLALHQNVVTAVMNSIGELYIDDARVIAAMYRHAPAHLMFWDNALARWRARTLDAATACRFTDALSEFDAGAVARYRARCAQDES